MSQDGHDVTKDVGQMQELSLQARARQEAQGRLPLLLFLARAGQTIPAWWSKERDREMDRFWKNSDQLSGAFYTLASKLSAVPFRVEARDPGIALHRRQAEEYQELLEAGSEFGQGWMELATLSLLDLWTQDNGFFNEVIGAGPKDGPIKGLPVGLAHLDSLRCHRTGSLEYPVQYEDTDGRLYKLHRSRVLFRSQMPSTRAEMYRVGFCWLSRCINAAQSLVDDITYKQEKMGSRPKRGIIITGGGLDPEDLRSSFEQADLIMDSQALTRFSKFVIAGANYMPDARITMLDLASLPDGFDWETDLTLCMFTIAMTGGFPPRWIWPATTSGATKADAMYQHVAGLTGGPGATLQMLAQMIGGPERGGGRLLPSTPRFLPPQLKMVFDFQDDEQDRTAAEIRNERSQARERDVNDGIINVRVAREQMVSDGEISEAQFADMELEDGRLGDGSDVLTLFNSPDPFFRDVLALGLPEPLDVTNNGRAEAMAAIEQAALDCMAIAGNPVNARQRDQAKQALAALQALKALYEGRAESEADEPPVVEDEVVTEEPPVEGQKAR